MFEQLALGTMVPLVAAGVVALVRTWARTEQSARDITDLRDDLREIKDERHSFSARFDSLSRDLREWREQQIRFEERLASVIGHEKK